MTEQQMWNCEERVADVLRDRVYGGGYHVPAWVDGDITPGTVAAICQGGCASGAYMPSVTYTTARDTMNQHGDDVLQYLQDRFGELPTPPDDVSWGGLAVFYLSAAVEEWARGAFDDLESTDCLASIDA